MATATTHSDLIGSDRVEGTAVYSRTGDRIGQIERIMIEKVSGKAVYALMSFGGFLGIGEDYYPVPWSKLTYDTKLGGYATDIDESQLKNAPTYADQDDGLWADRDRSKSINDHYGVPPYWTA